MLLARFETPHLWPAAVFAVSLAAAMAATVFAVDRLPALREAAWQIVVGEVPSSDDFYLATDAGTTLDHHVLYFDLDDEAATRLRAAEVLFVGNSRLMFALRPEVLRPAFAARRQSYYVLGFGFRETDRFPLALIRKLDLRPRIVVVNSDGFFAGAMSAFAETVIRDTPFAARKLRWEGEAAHAVRRVVHIIAPNWLSLFGRPGLGRTAGLNLYRSRFDGTWAITPWPSTTATFLPGSIDGPAGRGEIAAARAFKAEIERRGARLVLTRVPTPQAFEGAGAATFARLLDVPLVTVDTPGLTSSDHSHLDEASAHDWSREFMTALAPHLGTAAAGPPGR